MSRVDYPNNYATCTDPLSSIQFYVNYIMYYMYYMYYFVCIISNTKKIQKQNPCLLNLFEIWQ